MNAILKIPTMLAALIWCGTASASLYTYSSGPLNAVIYDNDANGYQSSLTVSDAIGTVNNVSVNLNIAGGYNGDLYASLLHLDANGQSRGFAVLLNRVGVTAGDEFGNSGAGFMITLRDSASSDIHTIANTLLAVTGTYQPDGRNVNPDVVVDTDPRTAFLSSFNGVNAGGSWILFVADRSLGDESTLVSWDLQITTPVPEPATISLAIFGGLVAVKFGFSHIRRKIKTAAPLA